MTPLSTLVALLAAASPCDDAALLVARLSSSGNDAELAAARAALEERLDQPLLRADEQDRTLTERAGICAARAGSACALLAQRDGSAWQSSAALTAILERPEFAGARDRQPRALGEAWERLKDWLLSLLEDRGTRTFAAGVRWAVLAFVTAAALAVAVRAVRLRRGPAARPAAPPGGVVSPLSSPEAHLARARSHLPHAPRDALREGLLGLLSSLERGGWLRPGRAETNREVVALLTDHPAQAQVAHVLRGYDRRFYSLASVTAEEAAAFLAEVESLGAATPGQRP